MTEVKTLAVTWFSRSQHIK